MDTSAAFSSVSSEEGSVADRLWQFLQDELKKPGARQKNEIVSSAAFFRRPMDQVRPQDFIYAGASGSRKSTAAAFIRTPEAVFVMRQFSSDGNGKTPVLSLREMRGEGDIHYEIHQAPTVLRGQIINNFSPQLALDVMDEARKRNLLPVLTAHSEVVVDFDGKIEGAVQKLGLAVHGAQFQPQTKGSAVVSFQARHF